MSASTTGRVGLDGQIKRVFPHELKMTETNPMASASMSASFDRTSPKGTLSSDRLARRGGPELFFFRRTATRPPPRLRLQTHRFCARRNHKGDIIFISVQLLLLLLLLLLPSFLPFSSYLDPTDLCLLNRGHSGTNKAVRNPHPAFPQAHPYFSNKDQNHRHYLQRANIQQPNISPLLQIQASKLHIRTILPKSLDLDLEPLWFLI